MTRVHIFPQCAELRKVLASFLLANYSHKRQYYTATSQIALSAINLVHVCKTKKYNYIALSVNYILFLLFFIIIVILQKQLH